MLKKINAWLHLWLGLASGIVVFVVALTGCVLVFEQEAEQLTQPWLHAERPAGAPYLPPSVIHRKISAAFPGKPIYSVWYNGHDRSARVDLKADSVVYVNPYTADIVGIASHEDFFHFVLEGHTGLWIEGEVGQQIVAWSTLIFFVLLVTGLVLWWPKKWSKTSREKSFTIKWKATVKRINYDLHNVLGFYTLVVAALIAVTGLIMAFAWVNKGVYWLASGGGSPAPYHESRSDTTRLPLRPSLANVDRAFRRGITELGTYNKDAIIVSFPDQPSDPISLCVDMDRGSWRYVYLDQYTLNKLPSDVPIDQLAFADWLRRTNYALHVGAIGNLPTKILYFITSLICASLPVTGFYIWYGRRGTGRCGTGRRGAGRRKKTKGVPRNVSLRYEP